MFSFNVCLRCLPSTFAFDVCLRRLPPTFVPDVRLRRLPPTFASDARLRRSPPTYTKFPREPMAHLLQDSGVSPDEVIGRCRFIRVCLVLKKVLKHYIATQISFRASFRPSKFIDCSMDFYKSTTKSKLPGLSSAPLAKLIRLMNGLRYHSKWYCN